MEIKIELINKSKEELLLLINTTEKKLESNIIKIDENNRKHKEFLDFIELMKLYEIYKWSGLKMDYIQLKKDITKDKKVYKKITKNYGLLISYFDSSSRNQINNQIKKIGELNDKMLFHILELKKIHYYVHNQCKYMIRNSQIIKIEIMTDDIKPFIQRIYENYIDMQIITKQVNNLRSIKMSVIRDITKINNIKNKCDNIF